MKFKITKTLIAVIITVPLISFAQTKQSSSPNFPRITAVIIGGQQYYDQSSYQKKIAKADLAIFGFYKEWNVAYGMRNAVQAVKSINPKILIGQYTNTMEVADGADAATQELRNVINTNNWWARTTWPSGEKVSEYPETSQINITAGANKNKNGDRYPQWYANWCNNTFFSPVPEFDFWFSDNCFWKPRSNADWNQDGKRENQDGAIIQKKYRQGDSSFFNAIRRLKPGFPIMVNADNDLSYAEYKNKLEYVYFEGAMGKSWSIETWGGWQKMMERYRSLIKNSATPHYVVFSCFGDISSPVTDAQQQWFRYCFTSCLMDDGFFSFTDNAADYTTFPWFSDYGYNLGKAIDAPPLSAWQHGVYKRTYEKGVVIVNPTTSAQTIKFDDGFTITLDSKDGYIRRQVQTAESSQNQNAFNIAASENFK